MQRIISICLLTGLLLFGAAGAAPAQDQGDRSYSLERFSPERLTLNIPAGRSSFQLSTRQVLIKFFDETPVEVQRDLLREEEALQPFSEDMMLPAPRVAIATLRDGISEQEVVDLLGRLNTIPEIRYANPFLVYEDGTEMGIQDRLFVRLRNVDDAVMLADMAREHGAEVVGGWDYDPQIFVLRTTERARENAFELAVRFQSSGRFDWVEPDFLRLLQPHTTNDTYLAYQWALNNTGSSIQYNGTPGADMEVFAAWNTTTGSSTVKVAIIDEGVDLLHPDLAANLLPGYDATQQGSAGAPQGNDAHGTNCAGIVSAVGNNNLGIAGIAYSSKIVPVRIAYGYGSYWATTTAWIADGLNWAWQTGGADVLSNSWGGGSPSTLINAAIDAALNNGRGGKGASVLFSAGNGNGSVKYPANYNQTIAVAAMSMCDTRKTPTSCDGEYWWGSDYGTNLDVAAPGVKIYSTDISGSAGYTSGDYTPNFNGTSSACPNAAAVMALIYSVNPLLTHSMARDILEQTTEKVGGYTYSVNVPGQPNGTWSTELGYGRVNAAFAVKQATFSICLTDIEPPTIIAPPPVQLGTAPGQCSFPAAQAQLGTPTVTDNCPDPVTVTNDAPADFPLGTTIVTWTATDGKNNVATATQEVTVTDTEPPMITNCPADYSVEGDAQNMAPVPDFRPQLLASDNCTMPANLQITQIPAPTTLVPAGDHPVEFMVYDAQGLSTSCSSLFTVVPRVEFDPEETLIIASSGCKYPVAVTRSVRIDNSGGTFGNGVLTWSATTSATEITLLTASGTEGQDLVFRVDPGKLASGTHQRTITLTGYNSATMARATNSPFTLTISIQMEPQGNVSVTQSVGTGWTPFLNSAGHKVAEVRSNGAPISSFTVNMYPCMLPRVITRLRYVRRYFTVSSSSPSTGVDIRFYYTNTEMMPMVSNPEALHVYQYPTNRWLDRGGSSNPLQNYVELTALNSFAGYFTLAHGWFPKDGAATAEALPAAPQLRPNYPNPFNPVTTLTFSVPERMHVRLSVYDVFGRRIATAADASFDAGTHHFQFDGTGLPTGTYFAILEAGGTVVKQSMTLMK